MNPYYLICDPYKNDGCMVPAPPESIGEDSVCAYKYADTDCAQYSMYTYPSKAEAEADGAYVTHYGNCGVCSTAQDLGVYMNNFDMTTPARRCALLNLISESLMLQCYAEMGMTAACGKMWGYNSQHTRD